MSNSIFLVRRSSSSSGWATGVLPYETRDTAVTHKAVQDNKEHFCAFISAVSIKFMCAQCNAATA